MNTNNSPSSAQELEIHLAYTKIMKIVNLKSKRDKMRADLAVLGKENRDLEEEQATISNDEAGMQAGSNLVDALETALQHRRLLHEITTRRHKDMDEAINALYNLPQVHQTLKGWKEAREKHKTSEAWRDFVVPENQK